MVRFFFIIRVAVKFFKNNLVSMQIDGRLQGSRQNGRLAYDLQILGIVVEHLAARFGD